MPRCLPAARENAARAGVGDFVSFEAGRLSDARARGRRRRASSPPIRPTACASRIATRARALMKELGGVLRANFDGWDAAILAGSPDAGLELGIRAERVHTVWNGALECRLLRLHVSAETEKTDAAHRPHRAHRRIAGRIARLEDVRQSRREEPQAAQDLGRARAGELLPALRRRHAGVFLRHRSLRRGGRHTRLAVRAGIQPRRRPSIPSAVQRRRNEALAALPGVTGMSAEFIHLRQRRRTTRGEQYEKLGEQGEFRLVEEGGLQFWVNFTDYLDTGLFLDHRITRQRLRDAAARKRFLNLFAYTGSATVYAAAGRARETTTVDMSATYLDWAQRNLAVNGFSGPRTRVHPGGLHLLAQDGGRRAPASTT